MTYIEPFDYPYLRALAGSVKVYLDACGQAENPELNSTEIMQAATTIELAQQDLRACYDLLHARREIWEREEDELRK